MPSGNRLEAVRGDLVGHYSIRINQQCGDPLLTWPVGSKLNLDGESWKGAAMSEPVRKLTDGELREAQGTPGLVRRTAFEGDGHWFGHVEAAPVTMSGWHHHGDNVTMGYVLKGSITLEFGPGGGQKVEVAEGEYFEVPKNTVHREGNMSSEAGEVLVSRVGEGSSSFPSTGQTRPDTGARLPP